MKKRNFYKILCLLYSELESAEQDEALKGDDLFETACAVNFDDYSAELFIARLEHKIAQKKVYKLKKQIKIIQSKID